MNNGIMIIVLFGAALAAIALLVYAVTLYNGLIYLRNQMDKAWANIDVLLKQRHDLIPNLVETVKGYATHERTVFENVTRARTEAITLQAHGRTDAPQLAQAEDYISRTIKSIFAVAEAYPVLKANQNFLALQESLVRVENEVAERREFFNNAVNLYNVAIQRLPDVFVARFLNFQPALYFRAEDAERTTISVSFTPPAN